MVDDPDIGITVTVPRRLTHANGGLVSIYAYPASDVRSQLNIPSRK